MVNLVLGKIFNCQELESDMLDWFISSAHAQQAAPPPGGGFMQIGMLVVLFVVFYFILIRPQQKQAKEHRKLVDNLKKGDEVLLGGGMLAKLTEVGDNFITAQISDNVEVKYQRDAVQTVLPKGSFKKA